MARRQSSAPPVDTTPYTENIVDIDVTSEMEGSFLEYAYSVIYSRALPDARDGLTRVERVVLYMLHQAQREFGELLLSNSANGQAIGSQSTAVQVDNVETDFTPKPKP